MTKHCTSGTVTGAADSPSPNHDADYVDLSRRTFLYGLSAMALSACGGGAFEASASSSSSPRMLASVASGSAFAHPGLLHTQADLDRMAQRYNTTPYSGSWAILLANPHASLSYTSPAVPIVYRGFDGTHKENYARLFNAIAAAYACALRWKISGDAAYADKSVAIMNEWSSTLTAISGTSDKFLAAGIYGYEFANAAELMRDYSGWAAADFARFQGMMRNIFYPMNHDFLVRHNGAEITHYWANWDLCNMASILAIGVLCDDRALFDEAVTYFKSGAGNGAAAQAVYYMHPGYLGQWQESGRDQGHNTLGVALVGAMCEMAWNQGVDLYGYDNNRILAGAEYVAKANLIESGTSYYTVPYVTYSNIDKVNQTVLSTTSIGNVRPCWALVYNHYVNRMGLAAPYTDKWRAQVAPEGGGGNYGPNSGGFDQLGYGTLTCTRDAQAAGNAPSGLSAYVSAGAVILSWWGGAALSSYSVKRAVIAGGPYTTVASGITDLLSYSDNGLAPGTYYYVVVANTQAGESAPSNEARATTGVQLHTRLKFDEAAGSTAADASGNGHDGAIAGGYSWIAGERDGAVSLDGSSGYVGLPADILTDVGDFTIATWVYWNAARTWERVFDFGSSTSRYMMMTARDFSGFLRFGMTVSGVDGEQFIETNAALPRSAWTHVAVTLSGRNATVYVNGVVAGTHSNMFFAPFRLQSTARNWIGRSQNPAHPYFNGKFDDFRIYRGALGADDVVALMNDQPAFAKVASVQLIVQGATFNRSTQKYAGGVTLNNSAGPALAGPLQLRLEGLTAGVSLDNASFTSDGVPYVTVSGPLAAGATQTVALSFSNPSRSVIAYTPTLYKNAF